VYVFVIETW